MWDILQPVTLTSGDPDKLPLPSPLLLSIHSRFSNSLERSRAKDQVRAGWPSQWWRVFRPPAKLRKLFFRFTRSAWLSTPRFFRVPVYLNLLRLGRLFYGSRYPGLQRVPAGLMIKYGRHGWGRPPVSHEGQSLRLVENYTDVPAPRLIETFEYCGNTYLIMTHVPGKQAISVFHLLAYKEREKLASDIRHCVMQFCKIPNKTQQLICGTTAGPVMDYRLNDNTCVAHLARSWNSTDAL